MTEAEAELLRAWRALSINAGVSGVAVRRYALDFADGRSLQVVTKPCGLGERRTLCWT